MDVFDQWEEGDRQQQQQQQQQPRARGGTAAGLGPNPFTPDNSPNRTQAAARRRPSTGGGPGAGADALLLGAEPQHAADVFSLRRIDLPASVLGGGGGGSAAMPTPRGAARAAALAASSLQASGPARTILHAAVQSHVLVLGLSDGCVVRWALDGSWEPEAIPVLPAAVAAAATASSTSRSIRGLGSSSAPLVASQAHDTTNEGGERIRRLFLDTTGNHLVVASTAAEYYYLHARAPRARRLGKWQGLVVESIAFDRAYGGEGSTKAILLGTDRGQIYETSLEFSSASESTSGGAGGLASASAAAALMGGGGAGGVGGGGAGKERAVVKVHELEQPLPIRALEFELLRDGPTSTTATSSSSSDEGSTAAADPSFGNGRLLLVFAATSNPVRLYTFLGGPTFDALFARYRDGVGSLTFQDFGGSPAFTAVDLHLFRSTPGAKANSLALTTEAGIFHGKLLLSPPPTSTDSIITEASLTEYLGPDGRSLHTIKRGSVSSPPRPPTAHGSGGSNRNASWPLSLALSEFHFLLLYPRRLQVVSRLSGRQVQHNPLPLLDEGAMGSIGRPGRLLFDTAQGTYWLYAEKGLFQVTLAKEEEGRFVWRLYLDKALQGDTRKFDLAYKHARDARARSTVDGAQAAYYFKRGQYELAARFYARLVGPPSPSITGGGHGHSHSFEEAALRFVEAGPEGEAGLRVFLLERLALLGGGNGGNEEPPPPLMGGGGSSSSSSSRARFKTQRVMLCTWLMELYLKRLAAVAPSDSDEGQHPQQHQAQEEEYDATVEELRAFLQTHIEDLRLHPPTTYELLASHGRKQETLLYATLIGDVERVVSLYLQDHDAQRALAVLESAPLERVEPLHYRHAHALLASAPLPTLALWRRLPPPGLDPSKLLPAIVHLIAACDDTLLLPSATSEAKSAAREARQAAVGYLERCVQEEEGKEEEEGGGLVHGGVGGALGGLPLGSSSGGGNARAPAILFTYLLQLYARNDEDEARLLSFLQTHAQGAVGGGGPLDLAHALRVCTRHGRTRACVHLYSCMGMYEEAVALALRTDDVPLAKAHADASTGGGGGVGVVLSPSHQEEGDGGEALFLLPKRLWLMIARHLIEVKKIHVKDALVLLEECPLLHIEDLLPHLPDLAAIDDVRDRICAALVRYSDTIKGLKAEMAETSQSAAEVERALQQLQRRHLPFSASQGCALCSAPAMASQFYLFPCRHAFHADCLAQHVLPLLSPIQRRAVHDLKEQLSAELTALGLASVPPAVESGGCGGKVSKRKAAQLEALQSEVDGYLAAECPLCGDLMIRTVGAPLLSEEEEARGDARAWAVD